jgi:hypothetical protein
MTHSKLLQHMPVRPLLSAAWVLSALSGDAHAQSEIETSALEAIRTAIAEGASTADTAALDAVVATIAEGSSTDDVLDAAALDAAVAEMARGTGSSPGASGIQMSRDGDPVGPFPFGNFKLVTAGVPFSFDIPVAAGIDRCASVVLGGSATRIQTDVVADGVARFHASGLPLGQATLQTICVGPGNGPVFANEPVFVYAIPPTLTGLGPITNDPPDAPNLVYGRRYRFSAPVTGSGIQACTATLQHNDAAFNVPATYDRTTRTVSYVVERHIGGERIIFSCRDNYERTITTRLELPPTAGRDSTVPDSTPPTSSVVSFQSNSSSTAAGEIAAGDLVTFGWNFTDDVGVVECSLILEDRSIGVSDAERPYFWYSVPVDNVTSGQAFYTTVVTPTINGLFSHGLTEHFLGAYVWCIDAQYNLSAIQEVAIIPVTF